jgi:hypothetical protein
MVEACGVDDAGLEEVYNGASSSNHRHYLSFTLLLKEIAHGVVVVGKEGSCWSSRWKGGCVDCW